MASDAKSALLTALGEIEEVEQELDAEVKQVAVVYSVYRSRDDGTVAHQAGWSHSSDPPWLISALLHHIAEELEVSGEDEPEDDE